MPTSGVAESMMHCAITSLIRNGHLDMGDAHTIKAKHKTCFFESSLAPLWLFVDESVHFCVEFQILQVTSVMVWQSPCVIIYLFIILPESLQQRTWKIFYFSYLLI